MPVFSRLLSYVIGFALVLPSLMVHEVAHGYAALACGDPTAKYARRLTFNPLRHIDPIGSIAVPVFLILIGSSPFGWARPVPINLRNTRNPRQALWFTAAAGPAANLVLAFIGARAYKLLGFFGFGWGADIAFRYLMAVNLILMVFNLFPIPPLDGSRIVTAFLPPDLAWRYMQLERYGFFIIILLFNFVPVFQNILNTIVIGLAKILLF